MLKNKIVLFLSGTFFLLLATFVRDAPGYTEQTTFSAYSYPVLALVAAALLFWTVYTRSDLRFGVKKWNMLIAILLYGSFYISSLSLSTSIRFAFPIILWHLGIFSVVLLIFIHWGYTHSQFIEDLSEFILFYATVSLLVALFSLYISDINVGSFTISQQPRFPRLYGWYGNPNRLGSVLAIAVLASLYKLLTTKQNILFAMMVIFHSYGLLLTGSRGSIVAAVIGCIAFLTISSNSSKLSIISKRRMIFGGCIAIAFSVFLLMADLSALYGRLNPASRLRIWSQAIPVLVESSTRDLLFGYGYGSFERIIGISPHNEYLRILFNHGLITLCVLLLVGTKFVSDLVPCALNGDRGSAFVLSLVGFLFSRALTDIPLLSVRFESFIFAIALFMFVTVSSDIQNEEIKQTR